MRSVIRAILGIYTTSRNAHDGWRPWTSVSEGQTKPGAPITAVVAGQKKVTLFLGDSVGGIYRLFLALASGG